MDENNLGADHQATLGGDGDGRSTTGPVTDHKDRSFTLRGVFVGLLIGTVICFSNMYFGLQTGWVSSMTMPASLMGFGLFKTVSGQLELPFTPAENVLVQTVAGSMAIMPLGCGFVGVIPAMSYLLAPDEYGPMNFGLWELILWSLGLCYFGVLFAVPLRRQVIIREKLKFPSGFSTAVLINVLHGAPHKGSGAQASQASVASHRRTTRAPPMYPEEPVESRNRDWKVNLRLLLISFTASGLFTLSTYFLPAMRNIPIFGSVAASTWLWTLNPSPAYIGQGIIMGPATTLHMLLGALVGWAFLSPVAFYSGWAPGKIDDWTSGSKGWIVWPSLAIMLADALVNLGHLALRSTLAYMTQPLPALNDRSPAGILVSLLRGPRGSYVPLSADVPERDAAGAEASHSLLDPPSPLITMEPRDTAVDVGSRHSSADEEDAPAELQVGNRTVLIGLLLSVVFCVGCIHVVFGALVPFYATVAAVGVAIPLSVMGVRALGETDLNPVSGISKLSQLFFAFIVPRSSKASIITNLVAGAVSEAGALQSGELLQDLKTGHEIGAAPSAQFWGQIVGSSAGGLLSPIIYQLYTSVYKIPGDLFPVPTGYVWIFTARLVTGGALPRMAAEWSIAFAVLFVVLTALRIHGRGRKWQSFIPGGVAVAVGMYNVPSFTLARTIGGVLAWWWRSRSGRAETPLIILASGLILGEGFLSILNLVMQSFGVPHA